MKKFSSTRVVLLGTGTPNAESNRSGPSVAVLVNGNPYIVDFGPGVVRRASAAGISVQKLNRAFLTHLHSDHTAGYPDLIFTPWTLGRVEPLQVYGPPGTVKMTEHIVAAYEQDVSERLCGLEPANTTGYHVDAHEISPGIVYQDEHICVKAFPVVHGSWDAFGFKIHTPDRVIVISGDTAPTETVIKESCGCDILIHEVYSVRGFRRRTPDWQKYHASVHTSTRELAEIAKKAQPKLLILYHQLFMGVTEDELLEEVREIYDGNVVSGNDLDVY